MRATADKSLLKTLGSNDIRRFAYQFTREDPVWHFADHATAALYDALNRIPSEVTLNPDGGFYISYKKTSYTALGAVSFDTPNMGFASIYQSAGSSDMKASLTDTEWTTTWDYGTGIQIGFTSIVDVFSGGTTTTLPLVTEYSALQCKRVETVINLGGYRAIVAWGVHRFDLRLSTITFWYVDTSTYYQLETVIQIPFIETFTNSSTGVSTTAETWTSWNSGAQFASSIYGIQNGDSWTIVANDNPLGRAVQFRWNEKNHLESQVEQVVQIDPDASAVTFTPTGLRKIGDLFYLSGSLRRPMTDGTVDTYAVFLTSEDAWNWSVGERNFFVTNGDTYGQLLMKDEYVYYIGFSSNSLNVYRASSRVLDGWGTADDVTDSVIHVSYQGGTDSADQISIDVSENTLIKQGDLVKFWAGWYKDDDTKYLTKIGEYIVDISPTTITEGGKQVSQMSLLDRAGRIQNDWKSSIDVARDSSTSASPSAQNDLNDLSALILKTPNRDAKIKSKSDMSAVGSTLKDVKISDGALFVDSINDPMVAYSTLRDQRDGVLYAEVAFQDTDTRCQQSFGFVFGGSQGDSLDGKVDHSHFNAILIPKISDWDGYEFCTTGPILVTSNLAPVYADGSGGWNTTARLTGLVESVVYQQDSASASALALTLPVTGISGTGFSNQEVRPSGNFYFQSGIAYQTALRKAGRRLQLYSKQQNYATASASYYAEWNLISEFKIDDRFRASWDDRPYVGIAANTDSWAIPNGFQMGAYGDIDSSLNDAGENPWVTPVAIAGGVNKTDTTSGDNSKHHVLIFEGATPAVPAVFHVGQSIWIHATDGYNSYDMHTYVTAINLPRFTVADPYQYERYWNTSYNAWVEKGWQGNMRGTIYTAGLSQEWGWATSGYTTTNLSAGGYGAGATNPAATVVNDPGTIKRAIPCAGKAFFVNDGTDSTAELTRYVETDNSYHKLFSGNVISGNAWDSTTPVGNPKPWSIKMNPSVFLPYPSTDEGLPASGYFKVEDEILRFGNESFAWKGQATGGATTYTTWCLAPTHYFVAQPSTGATTSIMQWISPSFGTFAASGIGSGIQDIVNGNGFLVEVRSRTNLSDIQSDPNNDVHIASVVKKTGTASNGNMPYITLDKAYPNNIVGPATGVSADTVIVSGRGQLGTSKATHSPSAPLVFYPKRLTDPPSLDPLPWLIRIDSFDQRQGLFNSIQDDLEYTCNLAGIRNVKFRNAGSYSGVLTDSYQVLSSSAADFVLDMNAHLCPGNELTIDFRKYRLRLKHDWDSSKHAAGRDGDIKVDLTAPGFTMRSTPDNRQHLDVVSIPVSSTSISGAISGGVLTDDPSIKIPIRLIARQNLVVVEAGGQHLWTINLKRTGYLDVNGASKDYCDLTPGVVQIKYMNASTYTVDATLQEISSEIESHIIDMGGTLSEAIGYLLEGRHIWQRSEPDGGILFTTNWTRENWSDDNIPLVENVSQDDIVDMAMQIAGHVIVSGAEFGESIDQDWIRQNGYTFELGSNRFMNTVQDSSNEAKILLRIAKEHSVQRTLKGPVIFDLQPLDRLDVYRPANGDIPEEASKGYVVKQIAFDGTPDGVEGTIETFLEASI